MKFTQRGRPTLAADAKAGWCGPPPLAERSCCCPARPVVRVLIPPVPGRPLPTDLLLCGHHYLASKAALVAVGAAVMDETGTVVYPPSAQGGILDPDGDPLSELSGPHESVIEVFP